MPELLIRPTGDCSLTVEFENEISIDINKKVQLLDQKLRTHPIEGVIETIPTYRTLSVCYKPELIRYRELCGEIQKLHKIRLDSGNTMEMVVELPVLYGGEFAPDMQQVMDHEKISEEEVIRLHSTNVCYVYMIGFAPGLPYIGNPEKTFTMPRLASPRVMIPRGSVTIWESQTTITPFDQPCGWNIIGRTPVLLYDPRRANSSYFAPGDWVKFRPVDRKEYDRIAALAEAGNYTARTYPLGGVADGH